MPVRSVTTLESPTSHNKVGKVGHVLLGMTRTHSPKPDEVAFEAIKAGIDSMPPGVKILLNSAGFYAQDLGTANRELLARFFEKYPDYADRTLLALAVRAWTTCPRATTAAGSRAPATQCVSGPNLTSSMRSRPPHRRAVRRVVASLGPKVVPIPGSTNAKRTIQNTYAADMELSKSELDEIWSIIDGFEVKGDGYFGTDPGPIFLWG